MAAQLQPEPEKPTYERLRRRNSGWTTLAEGEPMVWMTGGALLLCLAMISILLVFIFARGMATFWPGPLVMVTPHSGNAYLGEITQAEDFSPSPTDFQAITDETQRTTAQALVEENDGIAHRRLFRTGNFDLTNTHFEWVHSYNIAEESTPEWAILVERQSWGRFYGTPKQFQIDGEVVAENPDEVWALYQEHHDEVRDRWYERRGLETHEIGEVNARLEAARLRERVAEMDHGPDSEEWRAVHAANEEIVAEANEDFAEITELISAINEENDRFQVVLETAAGAEKVLPLAEIVRAIPSNQLGFGGKVNVYLSRWWEFLSAEPREANSEGGVFPAIFGTVLMTILMSIAVVPYGVMTALYLREYAKAGPVISAVRIAINNLAGVPSIVFGVFGLGFFCYGFGSFVDGGPANPWPAGYWFGALGIVLAAAIGAAVMSHASAGKVHSITPLQRHMRTLAALLWFAASVLVIVMVFKTPFFEGFYRAQLPNPTFGKGALVWASFTLALLTLPVVIVSTEEALSAVPNSMREGSYGCGASKWQTIRRIVLPRAMPGIMTGMILAMARGAGEVAPLMLVGAVKLAPELPIDLSPPFGLNRSFMHLGFHIYDLGFQSQNSEAAKPMVFTTTLLMIVIIVTMTLSAIMIRTQLKKRFIEGKF